VRANARIKGFRARWGLVASRLGKPPGMFISPTCPNLITEIPNLALNQKRGEMEYEDAWMPGSMDHALDGFCYGADDLLRAGGAPPQLEVVRRGW